MSRHFTVSDALRAVHDSADGRYGILKERGSLELGYYAPRGNDPQQPHDQDELYFVHSGHGRFFVGDDEVEFAAGDALFVPAGCRHGFREFSDDFGAWVVFYGPAGGETGA